MSRVVCLPFRFKKIEDTNIVTNDTGDFIFLSDNEIKKLIRGKVKKEDKIFPELLKKRILIADENREEFEKRFSLKNFFLGRAPHLHIIIVTLRCNQICTYCHASRASMKKTEYDMDIKTASKVIDFIFQSPSEDIIIEFQGGEPLANFETMKFIVEYALKKNKNAKKRLSFSLVSNLSLLDEGKLSFILEKKIQVCTSLDGSERIHNKNRKFLNKNSYRETIYWMQRINEGYNSLGLDPVLYHVEALLTVTRDHFGREIEIVDEYVKQGLKAIFLRPVNPFGYAKNFEHKIGYSAEDFLSFYLKSLDYIISLNEKGVEIIERLCAILLTKILGEKDPNYLDIRSPCGAGIGQIAYNYDGKIFTCDEGRMVYAMGDDAFLIGNTAKNSFYEVINNGTVKALSLASCLDCIPGCVDCPYKPYCGTCPVYNYSEQHNIFPTVKTNEKCRIFMGVFNHLFKLLKNADKRLMQIFEKWIEFKDRPFFYHE